ncbi:FecR family protein [Dyadobacter arcticus]|uniref:Ferric-dicitrate binding protein FerR (Iron transport regulator) n=1 Tax=Dyadobacter arcticus TaxID=1078754 RepID=A0ABX0UL09_9BACT|nr:FecR domain-containing protein [Dyadobacter arcticus]NIJ52360.1 ferric-dicitrate binding protein FerR (iron transport regulator) [Dyadobacter arcticus]
MDSAKLKELLRNYLKGKSSVSENKAVDDWYEILEGDDPVSLDDAKAEKIRAEMWLAISTELSPKAVPIKKLHYNWLRVAASFLLFGAIGFLIWTKSNPVPLPGNISSAEITYTYITSKSGERKLITLPDGSRLTLNSASSIRFQNNFTKARNVQIIDGEVFFDVKHDKSHPFIIKSGALTTQVLGTAFNIRAYDALDKMSVGVTRGKVSVAVEGKPAHFLTKGRQLVFQKRGSHISLSPFNANTLSWQQGYLLLNDASFEEMAVLMNKNYGVQISAPERSVKSKHFTASINTSMPYMQALEVITAIHHLKIKERRETIEIRK